MRLAGKGHNRMSGPDKYAQPYPDTAGRKVTLLKINYTISIGHQQLAKMLTDTHKISLKLLIGYTANLFL